MVKKSMGGGVAVSSAITVGLDIGYGVTKAIVGTGAPIGTLAQGKVVMFPSVMGHARPIKWQQSEIAASHPGEQIRDDEGDWFVGDLALNQCTPGELLRLRGRTSNEESMGNAFRARLAKVALGKMLVGAVARNRDVIEIKIATGLPVDHMPDAPALKAALIGQHFIQTDNMEFVANITSVMVMPQPYGAIYAQILTKEGEINPCHNYKRTGVVDVGTYTVDLTLDDDGEYVDAESGSAESGVWTAQERIAAALEGDYRQKMPYKVIESVLRTGCFRAAGTVVDYREEVEEALAPLRSSTLNLMGRLWQTGVNVDVIYLAGGGAALVENEVRKAYPQVQLVDSPQMANARGYLQYANFRAKES